MFVQNDSTDCLRFFRQEIRFVQLEVEELAMQAELESLCSAVEHMIQHDPTVAT